jgi:predicted nucleotidyltransferase
MAEHPILLGKECPEAPLQRGEEARLGSLKKRGPSHDFSAAIRSAPTRENVKISFRNRTSVHYIEVHAERPIRFVSIGKVKQDTGAIFNKKQPLTIPVSGCLGVEPKGIEPSTSRMPF